MKWYSPTPTIPPEVINGFRYPARREVVEIIKEKKLGINNVKHN